MNFVSDAALWFALFGALLIGMAIVSASLKRLPLTAAILYLMAGILLGPSGLDVVQIDPIGHAPTLRFLAELAVIVSLFTAGLKLRSPLDFPEWNAPVLLATVSMAITVLLLSAFGFLVFGLSWGGAILLAAILAPTDPVLASSVQLLDPADRDRLRFSLTAEAGLNDGSTLPFVLLGLYLVSGRPIGDWRAGWIFVDLLWGTVGGLGVGTLLGAGLGWLVGYFRRRHEETQSLDDFLGLGLIGLSYGLAGLVHANGFLAVFAAGLALRRRERSESRSLQIENHAAESGVRLDTVSGRMARGALEFNGQLERFGELIIVVLIGVLLFSQVLNAKYFLLPLFLFVVARPASVLIGVKATKGSHKVLLSWFGIRGVGSLYYLALTLEQGIPRPLATTLIGVTICTIATSILIHGLSATPLMIRHTKKQLIGGLSG